jgi:TrmH family RNA methyltransferase
MTPIRSRDNPRVRRWRELARETRARRAARRALIEGAHLIEACLDAGGRLEALLVDGKGAERHAALVQRAGIPPVLLGEAVFRSLADARTPAGIAAEIVVADASGDLGTSRACVFLEGVQDAGNVGAILRSAAAFGIRDAVLGAGCADAWSPKVLRAGMGAHFAMAIRENADLAAELTRFGGRLACMAPRGGLPPAEADLSGRIGWLVGAEGRGLSAALAARADLLVTIPMPGGAESLNVAAAAAICFYELSRRAARA